MKIYLAGNTPDRSKEERVFIQKGIYKNGVIRLISFYSIITDINVKQIFDLWTKDIR